MLHKVASTSQVASVFVKMPMLKGNFANILECTISPWVSGQAYADLASVD